WVNEPSVALPNGGRTAVTRRRHRRSERNFAPKPRPSRRRTLLQAGVGGSSRRCHAPAQRLALLSFSSSGPRRAGSRLDGRSAGLDLGIQGRRTRRLRTAFGKEPSPKSKVQSPKPRALNTQIPRAKPLLRLIAPRMNF